MALNGQNLNFLRQMIYLPGLNPNVDIKYLGFFRRKPRGFSNGHYLQVNPQKFYGNPTIGRRIMTAYCGCFFVYFTIIAIQQNKRDRWWFRGPHTPQFFPDEYLKELGRYKE